VCACEKCKFRFKTWEIKLKRRIILSRAIQLCHRGKKEDFSAMCKTQMIKIWGNTSETKKNRLSMEANKVYPPKKKRMKKCLISET
jgi:hypothetical protein